MSLFRRLRATLRPDRLDSQLDDELQFHIDRRAEDLIADGLPPDEARRQAALLFGHRTHFRDTARDRDIALWLQSLLQDLRFAARNLRRNRGFALTAILSLALGIGANTAVFSLLDHLLLKLAPVQDPARLLKLTLDTGDEFSYPPIERLRRGTHLFSGVVAASKYSSPTQIEESGLKIDAIVQSVSGDYFDVLGIAPWRGRLLHAPDARSPEALAVISESWWRRHYAAAPSALGAHFHYANRDFVIAGIAPPAFRGMTVDAGIDIWVPLEQTMSPNSPMWTKGRWLQVLGRLAPGVTPARAAAEASALMQRSVGVKAGGNGFSALRARYTRPLIVIECIAGLVLVIACANLANLMLAGAAARRRELAVRQAIGAGRGRLVRQLATESLLLAAIGGAAAIVVAQSLSRVILGFLPPDTAPAIANLSFQLDLRVLAFTAATALLTSVLFGLAPALRATAESLGGGLKETAAGRSGRGFAGRSLVVAEVALCTLLLVSAGLFVRTLRNLRALDATVAPEHVLVADTAVTLPLPIPERIALFDALRQRVLALPGIHTTGYSHLGQLSGYALDYNILVDGHPAPHGDNDSVYAQRVSPGFLPAMGTPLLAGRDFTGRDSASAPPVAIVNESFVRRFLPEGNPLGRRFATEDAPALSIEVSGLVADTHWVNLREKPRAMFYRPFAQEPASFMTLAIRTSGDPATVAADLSPLARSVDPRLALKNIAPFTEIENRTLVVERMVAYLSAVFGALALLVACIGLYGLLSHGVARRTREIGVRMALGATRATVHWMVLRESLVLLTLGFVIGIPGALAVTRSLAAMLFGLTPADPATLALSLALLVVVALAAAEIPARRASNVDPIRALREE